MAAGLVPLCVEKLVEEEATDLRVGQHKQEYVSYYQTIDLQKCLTDLKCMLVHNHMYVHWTIILCEIPLNISYCYVDLIYSFYSDMT